MRYESLRKFIEIKTPAENFSVVHLSTGRYSEEEGPDLCWALCKETGSFIEAKLMGGARSRLSTNNPLDREVRSITYFGPFLLRFVDVLKEERHESITENRIEIFKEVIDTDHRVDCTRPIVFVNCVKEYLNYLGLDSYDFHIKQKRCDDDYDVEDIDGYASRNRVFEVSISVSFNEPGDYGHFKFLFSSLF